MSIFIFQDFGSDVVGSTADSSSLFTIEFKLTSKPEISDLDLHFFVQKDISKFKTNHQVFFKNSQWGLLSMDDSIGMEILETVDKLHQVTLHFKFSESFSSLQKFVESLLSDLIISKILREKGTWLVQISNKMYTLS